MNKHEAVYDIKPVPNYIGYYASKCGVIFSARTGKLKKLKYKTNEDGYAVIVLCIQNKRKDISVHRCVALSWLPIDKDRTQVNHKDGDKKNNFLSNLEWVTVTENNRHAINVLKKRVGNSHANSKITSDIVLKIRVEKGSLKSIGQKYGLGISQVKRIKDRQTWAHV